MEQKTVEKPEIENEEAIAEIIMKMGIKRLPLVPSRLTMHLMAKAAVAVYEAVVENDDRDRPPE
jgi:MinD-like ATPase involved in chromosome partitioning or flagellar assembly